jgi:hypothetical protein
MATNHSSSGPSFSSRSIHYTLPRPRKHRAPAWFIDEIAALRAAEDSITGPLAAKKRGR